MRRVATVPWCVAVTVARPFESPRANPALSMARTVVLSLAHADCTGCAGPDDIEAVAVRVTVWFAFSIAVFGETVSPVTLAGVELGPLDAPSLSPQPASGARTNTAVSSTGRCWTTLPRADRGPRDRSVADVPTRLTSS